MPSVKSICIADFYVGYEKQGDEVVGRDTNHGKESEIKVGFVRDEFSYNGWLQFNLQNLPIDVSKKKNVHYKLYIKKKLVSFSANCYISFWMGADNAENYANGNKNPNTQGIIDRKTIKFVTNGEWLVCNIEEYLSEEYILYPFFSIELEQSAAGVFYSKESGVNNAPHILVEYEEIIPGAPEIYFPKNITCRNDEEIIFNWKHQADMGYEQTKYDLQWRKAGTETWTTITKSTSQNQHIFPEGTFPTGTIQWRVRTYNEMGNVSSYSVASFISVGESAAPRITSVTNDAFTTITWSQNEEQDMFEIELYHNGKRIYESGVQIGHNIYTFNPDIMLADGTYNLKIRMTNVYGEQTEWTSYQFVINTAKPQRPEVFIHAESDFTVKMKVADLTNDRYYAVRKELESGKAELLGEVLNGEYIDRTAASGVVYAYAVRAYNVGFSDSKDKVISVNFDGVVLYNAIDGQMLHLRLSEEEYMNIQIRPGKEAVYTRCIGRAYPVAEKTEWIDDEMSVKCFMAKDQWEILKKWFLNGNVVVAKNGKNVGYFDIASLGASNAFLNRGYTVDITLKKVGAN